MVVGTGTGISKFKRLSHTVCCSCNLRNGRCMPPSGILRTPGSCRIPVHRGYPLPVHHVTQRDQRDPLVYLVSWSPKPDDRLIIHLPSAGCLPLPNEFWRAPIIRAPVFGRYLFIGANDPGHVFQNSTSASHSYLPSLSYLGLFYFLSSSFCSHGHIRFPHRIKGASRAQLPNTRTRHN